MNKDSIFIVCGETSSDEHTAPVVSAIKKELGNIEFFGMGGRELKSVGMELVVDARTTASVMGVTEVIGKLGALYNAFWNLLREVDIRKPKIAVLVDFPDFNLRMAKKLHERGIKVVYFISPQLWAWRKGRIKQMKSFVDKIIPILPFEEDFYREHGVDAKYLGHPFKDKPAIKITKEELLSKFHIPNKKSIALLPGSRKAEVQSLLPILNEVANILKIELKDYNFIVPVAHSVKPLVDNIKSSMPNIYFIEGYARELMNISEASIVASGTATVEAALSRVPFCIIYKVSILTYLIGKILIRGVKYIGMPNLIAGKEIVKEFLQSSCRPNLIADEVMKILQNEMYRNEIIRNLEEVDKKLMTNSNDKVSELVAAEIINLINFDKAQVFKDIRMQEVG